MLVKEVTPGYCPRTGVPRTPAKVATYSASGACTWRNCLVLDYDEAANTYLVEIALTAATADADEAAELDANGSCTEAAGADDAPMWVPRVRLCFAAEDPFVFAKRFAEAHALRARADAFQRYSLYIDSMPSDDLPQLTTEQVSQPGPVIVVQHAVATGPVRAILCIVAVGVSECHAAAMLCDSWPDQQVAGWHVLLPLCVCRQKLTYLSILVSRSTASWALPSTRASCGTASWIAQHSSARQTSSMHAP